MKRYGRGLSPPRTGGISIIVVVQMLVPVKPSEKENRFTK